MKTWKAVLNVLLCAAAITLSGCRSLNNNVMDRWRATDSINNVSNLPAPALRAEGGIESSVLPEPVRGQSGQQSADLKLIYFAYDSASLLEPARQQLDMNAEWLRASPGAQIQIEGHCDTRGTADYNYALGQRRADTARSYLVSLGIPGERIHTISYGSERPEGSGEGEMAHARNRRAQFLVYSQ